MLLFNSRITRLYSRKRPHVLIGWKLFSSVLVIGSHPNRNCSHDVCNLPKFNNFHCLQLTLLFLGFLEVNYLHLTDINEENC